jgi:predicted dinucleotide-binding enzyme
MTIGFVGAGNIAMAVAKRLARAGHVVLMSNSRGPDSLTDQMAALGPRARAATVPEAIESSDVVFLAIPYYSVEDVAGAVESWRGKIVVDMTNYSRSRDGEELDPGRKSSSAVVAGHLRGARVVKAFNTIAARRLARELRIAGSEPDVIFYAGDDPQALQVVHALIEDAGCQPVYSGSLAAGGKRQEPGSDLYGQRFTRAQAEALFKRAG